MRRDHPIVIWGYLVELLLVGAIYGSLLIVIGRQRLSMVVQNHWQVFSVISGALFTAGVAALLYFAQVLHSEFGKYLNWRNADYHYLRAYQIQAVLFFVAGGVPVAVAFASSDVVKHLAWLVFLYACVNGITVVRNTVELVRLHQKFRSKHDALLAEMKKDQK